MRAKWIAKYLAVTCAVVCMLCLNGCTRRLYIELFNYTGENIIVMQWEESITIPANGHRRISFFGLEYNHTGKFGHFIQAGTDKWFYPVATLDRALLPVERAYMQDIGLGTGPFWRLIKMATFMCCREKLKTLRPLALHSLRDFPSNRD